VKKARVAGVVPEMARIAPRFFALCGSACLALAAAQLEGCTRGRAQGTRPDLAGRWDLAYDDVIDVEITLGAETHRTRVSGEGGRIALHDAGSALELMIDCTRPELVCPNETLDRDLVLTNRLGDLDEEGEMLVISFQGEGGAPCTLGKASVARAHIESHGAPDAKSWRAVALSAGRATSELSASCLMDDDDGRDALRKARINLSTGFSAVRR